MQSFKLHVVSEHLKNRYPYLEQPFKERYDKTEVYHAVFDRSIPKLIEILLMSNIEDFKYRDALITLNEMVSHQENKDQMITQGLVGISSAFLHSKVVEIRREAALLLGSLCSIKRGRDYLDQISYDGLHKLLFDNYIQAREGCAWCLDRILSSRDGVELLAKSKLLKSMIDSFLQYTENPAMEEATYIIMLLECFVNFLQYDNGIEFFVGVGIISRMNEILKNQKNNYFDRQWSQRINFLCLDSLAKACVNHDGKQEGINVKIIFTANQFLDSPVEKEIKYAVVLIMNCTIHLDGKKQGTEDPTLIQKLINLLDSKDSNLRKDVKQALTNIAEYPKGFLEITSRLATQINYLDEVFGPRVITALADLLPKTSQLENPPILPSEKVVEYKSYCIAICFFILNHDEAHKIAVEEIVKITEKLAPFLIYRSDKNVQETTAQTLYKICLYDQFSLETLSNYLTQYGEAVHEQSDTSISTELNKYKKLGDLLAKKKQTDTNINE